jgi:hypothetical protein
MLPNIDISLGNGQIGSVLPNEDRTSGVLTGAAAVPGKFELGKTYTVKGMVDVANLGIVPSIDNAKLYKFCKEFYQEAGEGTELWIFAFAKNKKVSDWFSPDAVSGDIPAQDILNAANGKIRRLYALYNPAGSYVPVIESGLDEDVWVTMQKAQLFAENYTKLKYSPIRIAIEGYAFDGNKVTLESLETKEYNRISVLIGDTEPRTGIATNYGAALGVLAGRMAAYSIEENIGYVLHGSLKPLQFFILDKPAELYDTAMLHDKSYITFRTHQGKSGYYFSDDPQACSVEDDYHSNTRGDVIDKAYRLTYLVQVNELLGKSYINEDGTPDAIWAKDLEGRIESYILANMGEQLQYRIGDESPVKVYINLTQNIATTSKLKTIIKVKPWGYVRDMETELSYTLSNN